MLLARARAFAYKDAFPDILKGIRSVEEEEDIILAEEPVTPVSVAPAPAAAKLPKPRGRRRASAVEILEADASFVDTPDPALSPVANAEDSDKAPRQNEISGDEPDDFLKAS